MKPQVDIENEGISIAQFSDREKLSSFLTTQKT